LESSRCRQKKKRTGRLLGMSSLKEGAMQHIIVDKF
jgi:hypothetical protein